MSNVYIGGTASSSKTHRKLDASDGTVVWSEEHGAQVNCIAVDSDGNVYIGGSRPAAPAPRMSHRKLDSDGAVVWSMDHGQSVWGIAVDLSGNVYTAGQRSSNLTNRKYASNGTLTWSKDHGDTLYFVAVDRHGNSYIAGQRSSNLTHRKLDSDGDTVWEKTFSSYVSSAPTIADSRVYLGVRGSEYKELLLEVSGRIKDKYPDRYSRFFIDDNCHTTNLCGNEGKGLDYEVDGVSVMEWLGQLIDDESSEWEDHLE